MSDRRYHFPVDRARFWATIDRLDEYGTWWPWLRSFDGAALRAGEAWGCTVQPPLPYTVRFTIHLVDVRPPDSIAVAVDGDVVGTARLEIGDHPDGCEVRLRSDLSPNNLLLRGVARAARPIAQFGHDWVLDTGARQFAGRHALK